MTKKSHWAHTDCKREEQEAKQAIFAMAEKAKEKAKNTETKQNFRSVRDLQYKDD